jgi:hypothetical protein
LMHHMVAHLFGRPAQSHPLLLHNTLSR